jgi:hypothetical protein
MAKMGYMALLIRGLGPEHLRQTRGNAPLHTRRCNIKGLNVRVRKQNFFMPPQPGDVSQTAADRGIVPMSDPAAVSQ